MAFLHLFRLRGSPFKPSNLSCQRFANWVWWEKCRESGLTQDDLSKRENSFPHKCGLKWEIKRLIWKCLFKLLRPTPRKYGSTRHFSVFFVCLFVCFCFLISTHYHIAFQIRQNIVNSITQLKINDTESVNQIASVLVEATKVEGEITPQSGVSVHVCGEISFWIHCTESESTLTLQAFRC